MHTQLPIMLKSELFLSRVLHAGDNTHRASNEEVRRQEVTITPPQSFPDSPTLFLTRAEDCPDWCSAEAVGLSLNQNVRLDSGMVARLASGLSP